MKSKTYTMAQTAGICHCTKRLVQEWVASGSIASSRNILGHVTIRHQDLVWFCRRNQMVDSLEELHEHYGTVILSGCNKVLVNSLDELLPEEIGLYEANDSLDLPRMLAEVKPQVLVMSGELWEASAAQNISTWARRHDEALKTVLLYKSDGKEHYERFADFWRVLPVGASASEVAGLIQEVFPLVLIK